MMLREHWQITGNIANVATTLFCQRWYNMNYLMLYQRWQITDSIYNIVLPTLVQHELLFCQRWYNMNYLMLYQRWQIIDSIANVGITLFCQRWYNVGTPTLAQRYNIAADGADQCQRWPNVSLPAGILPKKRKSHICKLGVVTQNERFDWSRNRPHKKPKH